jgi:hypothetical protein
MSFGFPSPKGFYPVYVFRVSLSERFLSCLPLGERNPKDINRIEAFRREKPERHKQDRSL